MEEFTPVLMTTIYHPKEGAEKDFLKIWIHRFAKQALTMGADSAHIYHNEESDEFLASVHWPTKHLANLFLQSKEFQETTKILNTYSLIPSNKEHFDVLPEQAA